MRRGEGRKKGEGDKINSMKKRKRIEMCVGEVALVAERVRQRRRERGRERIEESNTEKI